MALVPLSSTPEYRLTFANQDWRGWTVHDHSGTLLGHVRDLLVDTEAAQVVAFTLETGTQVPVELVHPVDGPRLVLVSGGWGVSDAEGPAAFEPGQVEVREWAERLFAIPRPHVIEEVVVRIVAGERRARLPTTLARSEVTTETVTPSVANSPHTAEASVEE